MIKQVYDKMPEYVDGKVAVLFTGGVESYLLGKLCVDRYGTDNVVFVVWVMDEYNVFYKKDEKRSRVRQDFIKSVNNVGGQHMVFIDNDNYQMFDGPMVDRTLTIIREQHSNVRYLFGGYNNIHKESFALFEKFCVDGNVVDAGKQARMEVMLNRDEYPEVFEFITKCDGLIYFVEEDYTKKTISDLLSFPNCKELVTPFYDLTKTQVVLLYQELGLLDDLFQSNSCNRKGHTTHCGVCRNCLARRIAISNAGIQDKTEYLV